MAVRDPPTSGLERWRPSGQPLVLLLVHDAPSTEWVTTVAAGCAVGVRAIVAPWSSIRPEATGSRCWRGFEVLTGGHVRDIDPWERVVPDVILHELGRSAAADDVHARLAESHPRAMLSGHPVFSEVLAVRNHNGTAARRGMRRTDVSVAFSFVPRHVEVLHCRVGGGARPKLAPAIARLLDDLIDTSAALEALACTEQFSRIVWLSEMTIAARGDTAVLLDWRPGGLVPNAADGGADGQAAATTAWFGLLRDLTAPLAHIAMPAFRPRPRLPTWRGPGTAVDVETLDHPTGRRRALRHLAAAAPEAAPVLRCRGCAGVSLQVVGPAADPRLEVAVPEPEAHLDRIPHPLEAIFPMLEGLSSTVDTAPWPDARFHFLHRALRGPLMSWLSRDEALLRFTGRVSTSDPIPDRMGRRFVEPGVGRSCLIDHLRLEGRPDMHDFTVSGVGMTPYSAGGYANVGRTVDGKVSLQRSVHRKLCCDLLTEAGCRAGTVAAIIELPGDTLTMLDGAQAQAALIVRAFASVLRVKQLDPLGGFYLSVQCCPQILAFLTDAGWEAPGSAERRGVRRHALVRALDQFGGTRNDLRLITTPEGETAAGLRRARGRRLAITYGYAPIVLSIVKARLALAVDRDPDHEPLDDDEYVAWFAAELGRQLATMHRVGFLHDYHQPGVSRYSPLWLYTLAEANVGLLAEFPDLDTGVFVRGHDEAMRDALYLTQGDLDVLREGFPRFHQRDVSAARHILRTLTHIVYRGDPGRIAWSGRVFNDAYEANA